MAQCAIEATRLLVVSRDAAVLRPIWSMGESHGWKLEIAPDPWEAIDIAQSGAPPDLLLLDLPQGNSEGLHSVRWLHRFRPALPIILIGHPGDNGRRQEGIRMGARDYLVRPLEERQLEMAIQRHLSNAGETGEADIASEDVEPVSDASFFIGVSPMMRKLRAQAALLAEANVPILITGEGGSGKETVARLVHKLSVRSGFPFARVNCAALPEDLLERELFGSGKPGAAASMRIKSGKLELCARGTIFLNEITELSPSLQSSLLEVVKNKRFLMPGTSAFIDSDVRVVAASSINMERSISESGFSRDLHQHLCAYTLQVPSLRDRKQELSFLSRHFMHRLARQYGLPPRELSSAIVDAWQAYQWPGNLRELEYRVKRYLLAGDEELAFEQTRSSPGRETHQTSSDRAGTAKPMASSSIESHADQTGSKSLRSVVQSVKAEAERNAIVVALEKTGWNRKAAARMLKVSYRNVLYKIEQYQLIVPEPAVYPRANGLKGGETGVHCYGESGVSEREISSFNAAERCGLEAKSN